MPFLERLPPPEFRVVELFCLQRKHLVCEYFLTFYFSWGGVVIPWPKPQAGAVRDCLLNLIAATLHIGGRSSIRNQRTGHTVVTGTHRHGIDGH